MSQQANIQSQRRRIQFFEQRRNRRKDDPDWHEICSRVNETTRFNEFIDQHDQEKKS